MRKLNFNEVDRYPLLLTIGYEMMDKIRAIVHCFCKILLFSVIGDLGF